MKKLCLTKNEMTRRMGMARAQLDCLLNLESLSTTLTAVVKAAERLKST